MTLNMPYHIDLNLQQRATLSAAIAIWNNQEVKDKIFKWTDNRQRSRFERSDVNLQNSNEIKKAKDEWEQLTKEVLIGSNQNVLPSQLKGELINIVKALGRKIYNWYTYIWYEYSHGYLKCDIINYVREIYWTPIGTIDEVKILQTFWLKNPKLDITVLCNIACKNALEKDIDDLWQKMPNLIKEFYDKFNRHTNDEDRYCDYLIFAYWKYRRDGQMDQFISEASRNEDRRVVYNQNYSVENYMFLLSVSNGWSTAVKYFWEKLTQEERDRSVLYSAYLVVYSSFLVDKLSVIEDYIIEKYVEIMIFLINQMTMDQNESFFKEELIPDEFDIEIDGVHSRIITRPLSIWPWQELFISVFKNIVQYQEHDTELVLEALFQVSQNVVKPCYAVENRKYQSMLHQAWFIIPRSTKQRIVQNLDIDNFYKDLHFMVYLLEQGDLDSIKMIFNDPEIADIRMQCIEFLKGGYNFLLLLDEYELLAQFMKEVLHSEEERIYLKSIIDPIDICNSFIRNGKYDSADKFLNWKFETIEERKQCKDYYKNYQLFMKWVLTALNLFDESVDKAKEETSRFLKWMLASENEITTFKKEFIIYSEPLIGEEISTISLKQTISRDFSFDLLKHTLSEEKIQKIKQVLA